MKRSILGGIGVLALLASLMGLAMASPSEVASELSSTDSSIPDDSVVSTALETDNESTPTSVHEDHGDDGTTSTTVDDDDDADGDDGTTSTTVDDDDDDADGDDGTTSTTIDDDDADDDDDDDDGTVPDQVLSHDIPGVGSVTVEVRDGRLELISISAPGWDVEVEAEVDEIEVKFRDGSSEVEFEAELEHDKVKIEIEKHSS